MTKWIFVRVKDVAIGQPSVMVAARLIFPGEKESSAYARKDTKISDLMTSSLSPGIGVGRR